MSVRIDPWLNQREVTDDPGHADVLRFCQAVEEPELEAVELEAKG